MPQVKWGKKPNGIREAQIKTTSDHLMPIRTATVATIKKRKQMFPRMWQNWESFCSTGGNVSIKWYGHCGKQYNGYSKFFKQNYHLIQQFHSWVQTQRTESRVSRRYLYIHVHSSSIHNCWFMEAKQIFAEGWMNKQVWYLHTMECYSALKKKKILILSITCMNPENTISEIRSDRKTKTTWFHLYMEPQKKTKSNSLDSIL